MNVFEHIKKFFLSNRGAIFTIIFLGAAIYLNSLNNEMFWDDDDFILKNRYVKDWAYFPKFFSENLLAGSMFNSNYWRPLLLTVFTVEWHLWKDWTPGWHLVNSGFHIADALLLFYILQLLFQNRALSLCTALIFLTHPVQVEAVVYVNSLGDSLSVFFMFSSILLYLKFRQSQKPMFFSPHYLIALVMFPLALLSKESGVLLPGFLGICDFIGLNRNAPFFHRIKTVLKGLWPFLVVAVIYVILRATVLNFSNTFNFYNEETAFTSSAGLRILTFFQTLQIYAGLILFPLDLRVERMVDLPKTFFEPAVITGCAIFLFLCIAAWHQWKKNPIITFSVLWFFIGLILTSNLFVTINALVYEHFLYVPITGMALLLVWCGHQCANQFKLHAAAFKLFILVIVFYCAVSIARIHDWRTAIGFYENLMKHSPNSYKVVNNLGMEYADRGMHEKARDMYLKAITLDPNNPVGYHNLAGTLRDTGRLDLAIENFQKAIRLDPGFIFSYASLANIYFAQKNYTGARAMLEEYLNRTDDKASTIDALIQVAGEEKNSEAIEKYKRLKNFLTTEVQNIKKNPL